MGCRRVAWIVSTLIAVQAGIPASPVDAADAAPVALTIRQTRPEPSREEALVRLIGDFVQAQRAFDVSRLTELTTADYLEISPVGEVDNREKMLGFYAPEKKSAAPAIEIREPVVRVFGNAAIVVARLAYTIQPPGQAQRVMELRTTFVAHWRAGGWKLVSAQYTAIRAAK